MVVSIIGVLGTVFAAILGQIWHNYVRPWLDERNLTDAAHIVVNAVEVLLGRYCGADKWDAAMQRMADRGFNVDAAEVQDALRSAWAELNRAMILSGEKTENEEKR